MDTSIIKKRKSLSETRESGQGDTNKNKPSHLINTNTSSSAPPDHDTDRKMQRENLVLWKEPIKTIYYFLLAVVDLIKDFSMKIFSNQKLVISLAALFLSYHFCHNIPLISDQVNSIQYTLKVCSYWVVLGILSSVGLGTGLHTFLLYLGPFIAKVTLASYECQTTDFTGDSFNPDFKCPGEAGTYKTMAISLFTIMNKVRLESFMWGAGTAIGELPPYFMARAARLAGLKDKIHEKKEGSVDHDDGNDDDDDFQQELKEALEEADTSTLLGKGKAFMHNLVNKAGFFGILLAASIPNPLFDLAGITCGHFLIPFWTFFGATLIGKAIMKMHIQMVFIIFLFSKDKVDWLISLLDKAPKIQAPFKEFMEKQRTKLFEGKVDENADSGILKNGMELFVISMVLYFVVSIINSMAQGQFKKMEKVKGKKA